MEILDRYLYEIGRSLPSKQREDILRELNTSLLDSMDEAKGFAENEESDDEILVRIIKDFGSPKEVAAKYASDNYLIGPQFYETYFRVLKFFILVIAIVAGVALFMDTLISGFGAFVSGNHMIESVSSLISSVIGAIGMVTIIFAIIERSGKNSRHSRSSVEFDPGKLPKIPTDRERIKLWEVILDLVGGILILVLLNQFSDKLNIYVSFKAGAFSTAIPIFNPTAYSTYLPFWNGLLVGAVIRSIVTLRNGKNTKLTNISGMVLSIFTIVALGAFICDPNLWGFSPASFSGVGVRDIYSVLTISIRGVIGLAIAAIAVSAGRKAYRMFKI